MVELLYIKKMRLFLEVRVKEYAHGNDTDCLFSLCNRESNEFKKINEI